jgi:hypothetical protein
MLVRKQAAVVFDATVNVTWKRPMVDFGEKLSIG